MSNHLGNGRLFSDVLVTVQPWVSLSCPEVQAPAEHDCVWRVRESSSPGGTELLLGHSKGHRATFPVTLGTFRTLKYSQCVLPFLCEAETSRSSQESQQQTLAFTSRQGHQGLPTVEVEGCWPRAKAPAGHRVFSSGSQLLQQQAAARDRQTDGRRQERGASFRFHISGCQAQEPGLKSSWALSSGPRVPSPCPSVAQRPGREGRPRKLLLLETSVSKRREWLDFVFSGW